MRHPTHPPRAGTAPQPLLDRLDALLTVTGYCRGNRECANPYAVLHPDGAVSSFEQAMDVSRRSRAVWPGSAVVGWAYTVAWHGSVGRDWRTADHAVACTWLTQMYCVMYV
jgi:hypothetical protein